MGSKVKKSKLKLITSSPAVPLLPSGGLTVPFSALLTICFGYLFALLALFVVAAIPGCLFSALTFTLKARLIKLDYHLTMLSRFLGATTADLASKQVIFSHLSSVLTFCHPLSFSAYLQHLCKTFISPFILSPPPELKNYCFISFSQLKN